MVQGQDIHEGLVVRDEDATLSSGWKVLNAPHCHALKRPEESLAPHRDEAVCEAPLIWVATLDHRQSQRYKRRKDNAKAVQQYHKA